MGKSKKKGSLFEVMVLNFLKEMLPFLDLDRMPLKGSKDEGDIRGLRIRGMRCVVECKNCREHKLSEWADEAEAEMGNADADLWFVVFKRKGVGERNMGRTYVLTDLDNLTAIAAGARRLRGME